MAEPPLSSPVPLPGSEGHAGAPARSPEGNSASQLELLADACAEATRSQILEERLRILTERAREIVGAHMAVLHTPGVQDDIVVTSEEYLSHAASPVSPEVQGLISEVRTANCPMRLNRAELESRGLTRPASQTHGPVPLESWLAVPLIGSGDVNRGVLHLTGKYNEDFTKTDELILRQLAHVAALNVEKAHASVETKNCLGQFRILTDVARQIIWTADLEGQLTYYNQRWEEYTGLRADEGLGSAWTSVVHPADLPENVRMWQEAVRTLQPLRLEHRLRRADGEYRWHLTRAQLLRDDEGNPLQWIGATTDVDEVKCAEQRLRDSEDRLRLAMEATSMGAWDYSPATGHLEWSDRCKALFGLPPSATVSYDTFLAAIHPEDRDRVHEAGQRALAAGTDGVYEAEYRSIGVEDGIVRWLRGVGKAIFDEQGRPQRFTGTLLDITAQKRAEEELRHSADAARRAQQEAERANRAKDDFIATLSHELRTPLTPVLMTAAALESDPSVSPEVREQISVLRRNAELEARLIDDLLDLTRITRGKLDLHQEATDIHGLLGNVVAIVAADMHAKHIALNFTLAARQHHVWGDPARLQQVFWNILKNAVKFSLKGGAIEVRTRNPSPDTLHISIADTGIGIEPHLLTRIFNAFDQGELTGNHRFGGLGLGLAISKAVIDVHGGTLRAESAGANQGARFHVELTTVPAPRGARPVVSPRPSKLRPLKLLLVEDHPETRALVARLLCRDGHSVVPASDVRTALSLAASQNFDLVISDLGLPDGSGLEVMQQLSSRHGLRGIALSGYGTEQDMQRSFEAGFSGHLTKPIAIEALKRLLSEITAQ